MRFRFFMLTGLLMGASLLTAASGFADTHLVTREMAQQRISGATAARESDLAAVRTAFSSPEATRAASVLGVDLAATSARLGTLDDADLHDLAVRAAALQSDPVAGRPFSNRQILWIVLIAAAVVIVILVAS
jgi:hypothetical protein